MLRHVRRIKGSRSSFICPVGLKGKRMKDQALQGMSWTSRRVRQLALIVAGFSAAATSIAFAPGGGVHVYPGSKTHGEITEEALATVYTSIGLTTVTNSMKEARKQIVKANKEVDLNQTESRRHFDGENFVGSQAWINSFLAAAVTQARSGDFSNARTSVGSALHTVQDFYAHTNWIELGNRLPSAEVGRPGAITNTSGPTDVACVNVVATCNQRNLVTSFLTSGYYGGEDARIIPGKCRHGGFFDNGPGPAGATNDLTGISKDSSFCLATGAGLLDSPHSDFNPTAAAVATLATVQVFNDLKAQLTAAEFRSLLGVGPSLGFAIDTTGSMGSVISGVRSAAISIVDGRIGTDREPSKYVLVPFNDPGVGPATSTSNATVFKAAINALGAAGGGDCPELAMNGTFSAVDLSDDGGDVFVFTDASAKDASLFAAVSSLASTKKVKVFFALFGSCSPYDPAYFSVANASGGQVFALGRGEASTITRLSDVLANNSRVDLESRQGSVSGAGVTIPFVVDTTMAKLNVSFSNIDATRLTLLRPDGVAVTSTTPGVSTITLSQGVVYSVSGPQSGLWRAVIAGTGEYSLLVSGESPLSLDDFSFVELGGRRGHQGFYPVPGLPLIGTNSKAVARVSGGPTSTSFEFRDLNGNRITSFALNDADVDANFLSGNVTVPGQSFRVYAVGGDPSGMAFQRLIATVVFPQSVSVRPPAAVDLGQGQTTTYVFEVRNDGAAGTFSFAAKDTASFVFGPMVPASATLASGASILTRATLRVGATVPVGTRDTLTVTATSATDPTVRNFAVLTSSVTSPLLRGDVNRDGIIDCADLTLLRVSFGTRISGGGFNPILDLDGNGVIDIRDLAIVSRLLPAGTTCN